MTKRALVKPFVVGPPRVVSTRTRLFPSDADETLLREIGDHLGGLLRSDLAARCRLGAGHKHLGRAKRKRALALRCSSRWAGAITRVVGDMWERELLNLGDLESRDRKVCGIPTAKFVHTIASAAYRNGMVVIAVDPAYTSIWGARYWKKPLDRSRRQRGGRLVAVAVVIGRRSQGHSAKGKDGHSPCRPEDRYGKATVQQTANTNGMAHTAGNDQRERSLVGVTTAGAEP